MGVCVCVCLCFYLCFMASCHPSVNGFCAVFSLHCGSLPSFCSRFFLARSHRSLTSLSSLLPFYKWSFDSLSNCAISLSTWMIYKNSLEFGCDYIPEMYLPVLV